MLLNCGAGEDSWESLGLQGDPTSPSWRRSVLGVHWKVWCWSWNSTTLATWCQELTHWKRPWCWERLKAGGEGDDRGWDGWMTSPTRWTWVWASSRRCWRTGKPGVLQFMELQRVGCNSDGTTTITLKKSPPKKTWIVTGCLTWQQVAPSYSFNCPSGIGPAVSVQVGFPYANRGWLQGSEEGAWHLWGWLAPQEGLSRNGDVLERLSLPFFSY